MYKVAKADASARFFLREGMIDLNAASHRDVWITDLTLHPEYDPHLSLNDVALVKLARNAKSPRQKLVAGAKLAEAQKPGRMSTVIGYGRLAFEGSASSRLKQVDLPIVAQDKCVAANGADSISDANFCAGLTEGGKDSCQGDSGGPLFVPDATGQQLQIGVVSWGKRCAEPNLPGVYASVAHFEGWLRSHVRDIDIVSPAFEDSNTTGSQAAVQTLTEGATESAKPSTLAQVTLDLVGGDQVKVNTPAQVRVTSSTPGLVVVFNENPDGRAYQLYPSNSFPAPGDNPNSASIKAGEELLIPSQAQKADRYAFIARPPLGVNVLHAIVVPDNQETRDLIAEYADGRNIDNLADLLKKVVRAEFRHRGLEATRVDPIDRGSAERTYQILP
jgi:hypothetical protein